MCGRVILSCSWLTVHFSASENGAESALCKPEELRSNGGGLRSSRSKRCDGGPHIQLAILCMESSTSHPLSAQDKGQVRISSSPDPLGVGCLEAVPTEVASGVKCALLLDLLFSHEANSEQPPVHCWWPAREGFHASRGEGCVSKAIGHAGVPSSSCFCSLHRYDNSQNVLPVQ